MVQIGFEWHGGICQPDGFVTEDFEEASKSITEQENFQRNAMIYIASDKFKEDIAKNCLKKGEDFVDAKLMLLSWERLGVFQVTYVEKQVRKHRTEKRLSCVPLSPTILADITLHRVAEGRLIKRMEVEVLFDCNGQPTQFKIRKYANLSAGKGERSWLDTDEDISAVYG